MTKYSNTIVHQMIIWLVLLLSLETIQKLTRIKIFVPNVNIVPDSWSKLIKISSRKCIKQRAFWDENSSFTNINGYIIKSNFFFDFASWGHVYLYKVGVSLLTHHFSYIPRVKIYGVYYYYYYFLRTCLLANNIRVK